MKILINGFNDDDDDYNQNWFLIVQNSICITGTTVDIGTVKMYFMVYLLE